MTSDETTEQTVDGSIESITDTAREQLSSRRGFLASTATVGGGAFALGASGIASAESGDGGSSDGGSSDGGSGGSGSGDDLSDLEILNYALTLEHLENTFYRQGLDRYSDEELAHAELGCGIDLCEEVRMEIPEYVRVVGEHEAAHVKTITKVIKKLGGDPVEPAEYNFGYDSPGGFLEVAMALENTGVAAYAGVGPSIKSDKLVAAALSIHSVEARHASLINFLNGTAPFPEAFDDPKSVSEVKKIASQFIVSEDE